MLLDVILLLVFLVLLSKSADLAVEYAENISYFFGISNLAVGFLLISVLTSLPELSISISASLMGSSGIVFGNVFSSNLFDMFFIIGVAAIVYNGIKMGKEETSETAKISLITIAIITYIVLNSFFGSGSLGFVIGILLLGLFCLYAFFSAEKKNVDTAKKDISKKKAVFSFILFVFAIIAVLVSAGLAVDYAIKIAAELHLSEGFIGATLFTFGSTLPELSVTLQAVRRKSYGIGISTCFGSTLVNITLVLGSALVLHPINVASINHVNFAESFFMVILFFNMLANAAVFYIAMTKKEISRTAGILFVVLFAAYLAIISYLQF